MFCDLINKCANLDQCFRFGVNRPFTANQVLFVVFWNEVANRNWFGVIIVLREYVRMKKRLILYSVFWVTRNILDWLQVA